MPVFNGKNVPNEIFSKIVMKLDGRSLHTARQVCQDWNSAIKGEVLGTVEGRREMERTLQHQWREATPARLEFTPGDQAEVLTINDPFAVLYSYSDPDSEMLHHADMIRVVNIMEGVEVMEVLCSAGPLATGALLTKDVLLLVRCSDEESEVLAWVHTGEQIFNKKFPPGTGTVVFDYHHQQVMLGRSTRLEISGDTIIETNQPPIPGSGDLRVFSHPYYITREPSHTSSLWKIDGITIVQLSAELAAVGRGELVFCHDILILCEWFPWSEMSLRIFNSLTGQIINGRFLDLPIKISGITFNANQLVVCGSQRSNDQDQEILLLYELEALLSHQDISPRVFEISQPGFISKIYLNDTSINMVMEDDDDEMKIITLDFWSCEN